MTKFFARRVIFLRGALNLRHMLRHLFLPLAICVAVLVSHALALDPRNEGTHFEYRLYPPGGFSAKKSKAIPRPDPKQPKAHPIIGADGKFTEFAQWYFTIGSDPAAFAKWWNGYWADEANWKPMKTPVYAGPGPGNQGHRIIAWVGQLKKMVDADPEIDPAVKEALISEDWKRAAEKTIAATINARGLLGTGGNSGDMAQAFHFIRSKFGAMRLKTENIYTLDRAQTLVVTLLTDPSIINEEDRYLAPPDAEYLESIGRTKGDTATDIRIVKDGKVLWSGGLFSGWRDKPSLHGSWDALAILNSLFKYYPEPDPSKPTCIFHQWNQLPETKKEIGKKAFILHSRRLWLDWAETKGPTWCWVTDGKPTDDASKPSEAPLRPAYDGYGDNQFGWARQCWDEMFGDAMRNTNDGVQALLAIAHGGVLKKLTMPVGQQVGGRYDYSREQQLAAIEADRKSLDDPKTQAVIQTKYGLTLEQARQRLERYVVAAGLPPGMTQRDEAPKLDPKKSDKVSE